MTAFEKTYAERQVDRLAEEFRKVHPEVGKYAARAHIWQTRPDLRQSYDRDRLERIAKMRP